MTFTPPPLEDLAKRYSRYYVYIEPVVSDPLVRGYFNLVASFLLVAFFLVFALSPTINTILALQKKIVEQRQVVAALEQKINNLVTAQANYSQIENEIPILTNALPLMPTPQTILTGVITTASVSGLVLIGLQFQSLPLSPDSIQSAVQAVNRPGALKVPFTLNSSGPPNKIHSFLLKMENVPRLIHISSMGIATDPQDPTMNSINLSAEGYYLPEENNE